MSIKDLVPRFGRKQGTVPVRRGEADPFHDFQLEMNRLFDDFFGDFPLVSGRMGLGTDLAAAPFSPRVDVAENDTEVKVTAELAGMDEKDVNVEVDEDSLTLRGEKKEEHEDKGKNWFRKEQTYGSFHRVIPLPARVDGDKAKAAFKKGLLTVTLPKRPDEQARRKTIEIHAD